jgi:hypothetical protein
MPAGTLSSRDPLESVLASRRLAQLVAGFGRRLDDEHEALTRRQNTLQRRVEFAGCKRLGEEVGRTERGGVSPPVSGGADHPIASTSAKTRALRVKLWRRVTVAPRGHDSSLLDSAFRDTQFGVRSIPDPAYPPSPICRDVASL